MGKHFHIEVENDHDALVAMLAHLNGENARIAINLLIDKLDALDIASNPDEPDFRAISDGLPGNPDDAEPDNDGMGDQSWSEWHTRGRHKLVETLAGSHEPIKRADGHGVAWEDDEDDDPAEEDDPAEHDDDDAAACGEDRGTKGGGALGYGGAILEGADGETGHCPNFGVDQTKWVSEGEAFHDLNGIPLIRVPLPENDR